MPYIKEEDRLRLDYTITTLAALIKVTPNYEGDLNYSISKLIDTLLQGNLKYSEINRIIGALECAKLELYRRVAAPYEDVKIMENGDVYTKVE